MPCSAMLSCRAPAAIQTPSEMVSTWGMWCDTTSLTPDLQRAFTQHGVPRQAPTLAIPLRDPAAIRVSPEVILSDDAAYPVLIVAAPKATLDMVVPLAPVRPLSARDQSAVISLAARAPTLTVERLDELAANHSGKRPFVAHDVMRGE